MAVKAIICIFLNIEFTMNCRKNKSFPGYISQVADKTATVLKTE
jgi:hypothetical protein